ncbi:MAG TPA: dNTP triphosphohydrolase [Candidatus Cloacimonadota bacterium]|jgi:dGTPase|nr:dNTP triphosphohydrolase [Candidatus Cloacimonadota bacterium]HOF59262.1 dNTP triphosphohydrolase [Candidatus Cloacimonadota bacterium]HOR58419.1 dNTP triphosphohydrolase [Candidatus Cloacimonadota bacterium]HPB08548.1 dNTP triphosphohydrolase [Candidatus Cloacimonadota bacterium]HQL13131.1 dNTP triphosphohydrolase [Candidatus Cloacimonadota bacterium]
MQGDIDEKLDWFSTLYEEAKREFEVEQLDLSGRNPFQRDRDRILSSKAFCRLDGKAQVFYADSKDHIRNRLTHSLGVMSLADNISRKLKLNCDLVEAIALGHDLGHTPYGHIGERILNQIMNGCIDLHGVQKFLKNNDLGFKHNWQGYRLVSELEAHSDKYPGLNLTKQTIWGIVNHTGLYYKDCYSHCFMKSRFNGFLRLSQYKKCKKNLSIEFYKKPFATPRPTGEKSIIPLDNRYWTPEAMVVAVADEIDQRIHDVADAYEFGIIGLTDILKQFCAIFENNFSSDMKKIISELQNLCLPSITKYVEEYNENIETHINELESLSEISQNDRVIIKNSNTQLKKKMKSIGDQIVKKIRNINTNELRSGTHHIQATFSRLIADLYIDNFIRYYRDKMNSYINKYSVKSSKEYKEKLNNGIVPFSISDLRNDPFWENDAKFHDYLKRLILNCHRVQLADGRASLIIRKIFKALVSNPMQLPDKVLRRYVSSMDNVHHFMTESIIDDEYYAAKAAYTIRSQLIKKYLRTPDGAPNDKGYSLLMRTICDFISGMTDQYAEAYYHELYGVKDILLEFK